MQESSTKPNQSLEKALQIIEYLSACKRPARLQDISAALGMPPSTVLRFLSTLKNTRYVKQHTDTSRYSLTMKICRLAGQVSAQHSVRELVRPYLDKLVDDCGESACLAVEEKDSALYIDVENGPDNMLKVMQRIGKVAPLYCTGVGKLLLLNRTEQQLLTYMEQTEFRSFTPHTVTSPEDLRAELNQVRQKGYAVDNEECELGARCVAVPLRDYTGNIVACMSVSGPVFRMDESKINTCIPVLLEASREVSSELGYEG